MRLLRVELTRYFSRRAIVGLLLLGALVGGALAFKTAYDTRAASEAEMRTAQAQADLAADDAANSATVRECRANPSAMLGPGATASDCAERLLPSAESMLERDSLNLPEALDREGARLAAFLVCLLVIAGATFAGGDWGSRSMVSQLLFVPRRIRLWLVKALAVALASAGFVLLTLAGYWLALLLVAEARGLSPSDADLALVGWHVVRAVALAAAAGVGAYALAMLFRHTVAALGLLFVYAAGSEILVSLVPASGVGRWTIGNNIFGWLKPDFEYVDPTGKCRAFAECNPLRSLTHLEAGWFLLVLLGVAVAASLVSFARRDA